MGAGALSGSGSVAGGGLIQRAARWSVRTGQSGRAVAQSRALERMGWGHKEGTTRKSEGKPGLGGEASQGLSSKTHRTGPWPCLALGRVLGSSPSGEAGTHQSAEGCETLRDPGGEWAAGERAGGPQPRAPGHGAGRGEHGGSPGLGPEGPESHGSCGHHQPGGEWGNITGEKTPEGRTVKARGGV